MKDYLCGLLIYYFFVGCEDEIMDGREGGDTEERELLSGIFFFFFLFEVIIFECINFFGRGW